MEILHPPTEPAVRLLRLEVSDAPVPYLGGEDARHLIIHRAGDHGQVRVAAADALRTSQVEAGGAARAAGQCGSLYSCWRDP